MQTSKKNIDNSEKRSHLTESNFKTILLVCLISFTSLLVRQTLQIQHSCKPMIHWSGEFPTECQVATKDDFSSPTKQELKTSKQQSQIAQNISKSEPNQITYDPPSPTSESSQHNTETESKNLLDVVVEVVVVIKNFLWWKIKRFL